MLVSKLSTGPTLTSGKTYVDFSANGEKVNHAIIYLDPSRNLVGQKYEQEISYNVTNNLVYVEIFQRADASNNWALATTSDLASRKLVVIADVT